MIRTFRKGLLSKFLILVFFSLMESSYCQAAVPLVIYSAVGYGKSVAQAFQRDTGIPVRLVTTSTGPLLARVEAESKNPQWDVVWFDGAEAMENLANRGLLESYKPPVHWNAFGAGIQPADHRYVISAATLAGVLVVNKAKLPESAWPHTWDALFAARYRNKVGMNNPAISGPTYPFVAGIFKWQGSSKAGELWFAKLKRHGLHVYTKNAVTLRALQYGAIDLAIVQSAAGLGRELEGLPFHVIYPKPVTLLPRVIGVSASAPAPVREEAERFIRFLLSKSGQKSAKAGDPRGDSNYYPLIEGIAPNNALPPLKTISVQMARPSVWGHQEPKIVDWFVNKIVHQ